MKVLNSLRHDNGIFVASTGKNYRKAWIRDNLWMQMVYPDNKTLDTLMKYFKKHEYKIDMAIKKKPIHAYEYIHARFDPYTLEEYSDEWGNKQNDAIGLFIYIALNVYKINNKMIQKLIKYLESVRYWEDPDNGVWEETEEIHLSSVACCYTALKLADKQGYDVNTDMLIEAEKTVQDMFPYETLNKKPNMSALYLIFPLNIIKNKKDAVRLLKPITKLFRQKGMIRYDGDQYYNTGKEAEWPMGIFWLAICYWYIGEQEIAIKLVKAGRTLKTSEGYYPESYLTNGEANDNTPLGWAHALSHILKEDE